MNQLPSRQFFRFFMLGFFVIGSSIFLSGESWISIPSTGKARVEPGSILDFSSLITEPEEVTGKYGPLVVRGSHFEWRDRPGKAKRFYGVNLCFTANYLDPKESEDLADTLWRSGYNMVRIHHYERDLLKTNATNSLDFDPAKWDRLDYLVYALKKRGIGITTDLFVNRSPFPGEFDSSGRKFNSKDYKGLVFIHPPAMENLKAFTKKFFEHTNPYTHLEWGKEPALLFLSYVNEDTEFWKGSPEVSNLYHEACLKKYPLREGASQLDSATFIRFCMERQIEGYQELKDYLSAMGLKVPGTDLNFKRALWQMPARSRFDFVDQHAYWDHPQSGPKGSRRYELDSYLKSPSPYGIFSLLPSRLFGKPFTVTEFNHVYPNPYRAESILMGAYASLQDWDAVFRFNYSNDRNDLNSESPIVGFNICNDPISLLADRVNLLMFLRRDVKTSEWTAPLILPRSMDFEPWSDWNASVPVDYLNLGLVAQIGIQFEEQKTKSSDFFKVRLSGSGAVGKSLPLSPDFSKSLSTEKNLSSFLDFASKKFISSTGELELRYGERHFRAVTPKSEALLFAGKMEGRGSRLSVSNHGGFAAFFAASMDENILDKSERILVLHLTDIQNSEVGWKEGEKNVLANYGKLPRLVSAGEAEIRLETTVNSLVCYACDLSGKRLHEVRITRRGNGVSWNALTSGDGKYPILVYELMALKK